jgi:pyridoxal phosphate enzyme (YggS family)
VSAEIAENLARVRDRIARAATAASRDPAHVRLIAVSKTKPPGAIRDAYAAGQRDFGENYAQELAAKSDELADLGELTWHFIGHLQTNKAKVVAQKAHVVHTVDSLALVRELAKRATKEERVVPVLVEVNVGREPQKHGAAPGELAQVLDAVDAADALALRGLMTMPPNDLEQARRAFEALGSLRNLHGGKTRLPELSMGMSDDLEIAIACGATLVRVGTAICGKR